MLSDPWLNHIHLVWVGWKQSLCRAWLGGKGPSLCSNVRGPCWEGELYKRGTTCGPLTLVELLLTAFTLQPLSDSELLEGHRLGTPNVYILILSNSCYIFFVFTIFSLKGPLNAGSPDWITLSPYPKPALFPVIYVNMYIVVITNQFILEMLLYSWSLSWNTLPLHPLGLRPFRMGVACGQYNCKQMPALALVWVGDHLIPPVRHWAVYSILSGCCSGKGGRCLQSIYLAPVK